MELKIKVKFSNLKGADLFWEIRKTTRQFKFFNIFGHGKFKTVRTYGTHARIDMICGEKNVSIRL